ncbi:piggyBac transposable element-derived protein 3-like isoform X2 [Eriocheir sinensis]|uniref:piggyBac transposable element-derived protein 3-like isoform X2 n=1 Tax=Eriocheir sinensis TaxID=95602 RepID=UPI0021C656DF|nr:piggyBac transposable element-derived protein 3-like isoform X2 [Eriocheir sinensis]
MNPEPDVSATSTTSLYNERGHRPRHMQLPMCSSDTEELDEYLYAVDEAYSPHKSEEVESSDENETPEDTVVLHIDSSTVASPLNSQTRPKTGQKRISRLYWEHIHYDRNEAPTIPIFDARNYSGNGEGGISLPIDLFRRFFTDNLIDMIVDQSNLYSVQENPNRPLNLDKLELEQWLGLCFHMSLSKISDIRLHWSVGYEKFSSVMRRDRWEEIKSRFHLVDYSQTDQQDKLSKVRPLLEHLRSKFKEIPMTEYLCVGEQVVPFKGNPSMEQYIPEKPHKRGCKFFVLADCMGMVYDFIPYTGKTEPVNNPNVPDLQGNSNSVLHLAECIPPFKNHKLYFDDQFTSLPLLDHLASRGIWCTGAIKENRIPNLTFMSDKLQALGQGFHDEWETKSESNNKITVLKWFDNKPVHLASTFATSFPLDKCTRSEREMKERVEVPRPFIVKDYNTHRFGVDLHDQLMSYYAMSFSSKEYYQGLIFHMIDMTVINSWLLHRREADHLKVPKRKQMSLCLFKLKLADSLLLGGKSTVKKRKVFSDVEAAFAAKKRAGKATKPIPDKNRRLDMTGHFPTTSNKRGLCKLPGCTGRVLMFCTKCEVNLCCESKRNCFLEFHTK